MPKFKTSKALRLKRKSNRKKVSKASIPQETEFPPLYQQFPPGYEPQETQFPPIYQQFPPGYEPTTIQEATTKPKIQKSQFKRVKDVKRNQKKVRTKNN
jgi:hypothetical protein